MIRQLLLGLLLCGRVWAQPLVPSEQLESWVKQNQPLILDVRSSQEVEELGTLEGAVHIPVDELDTRWSELPSGRPLLVLCQSGKRAERAAHLLQEKGLSVPAIGGLKDYSGPRTFPKK